MTMSDSVPTRHQGVAPVWVVADACDFRDLVTDVGRDLGLSLLALDADQAVAVVGRAIQPGAVLLDDKSLLRRGDDRREISELFGARRVVICTAQRTCDLSPKVVADPRIRILAKPFGLPALEHALRWLGGSSD